MSNTELEAVFGKAAWCLGYWSHDRNDLFFKRYFQIHL